MYSVAGGGVLNNFLQSAKYLIDAASFSVDESTTKREGVHVENSNGTLIFLKEILKNRAIKIKIAASGSNFTAEFCECLLESSKHWIPLFNGTTNEIIVRTNELAVDDKIYFVKGDLAGDQLPTGITDYALKWVKTVDYDFDTITVSNTQGGATLDFGTDGTGYSLLTKVEQGSQKEFSFDNTDNTISLSAHGFSEGQSIRLYKLAGAANPAGLTDNAFRSVVFVRNPTTNKFQISYTPASAVLTCTTDGTGTFFLRKSVATRSETIDVTSASKPLEVESLFDVKNGMVLEFYASNITSGLDITTQKVQVFVK